MSKYAVIALSVAATLGALYGLKTFAPSIHAKVI